MTEPTGLLYEVIEDRSLAQGGFRTLRRIRLRVVRPDGSRSEDGLYDVVRGFDSVLCLLYRRVGQRTDVLLRVQPRVPLAFPELAPSRMPGDLVAPVLSMEIVEGIIEPNEAGEDAIRKRVAVEVLEETGLTVPDEHIVRIGGPAHANLGLCAERSHFFACEVTDFERVPPPGDGSPFEEGSDIVWLPIDDAIGRCRSGAIPNMKAEVALLRLRDGLVGAMFDDVEKRPGAGK